MKSLTTEEELDEARNAVSLVGGKVKSVNRYTLKNDSEEIERTIIVIEKVENTPKKYPRNNSQIAKKPL